MKFNKNRLVGASNVDLPVVGADPSGPFILKSVDGLGPPEVDVSIANTVQEGGVYQGRRPRNRQHTLRVGLQPEWDIGQTAEELRTTLYGLLTPPYGNMVLHQIMQDNVVVSQASGHISKFETAIFTKDPEVQITLDCTHPYLLAPALVSQNPAKTASAGQTLFDVVNTGTAPSGFKLEIVFTGAFAGPLQIADDSPQGQYMEISGAWVGGDKLTVDTRPGLRGVWKTPSGSSVAFSILNNLSGSSPWLALHGSNNELRINTTLFDWTGLGFSHTPAYWGV